MNTWHFNPSNLDVNIVIRHNFFEFLCKCVDISWDLTNKSAFDISFIAIPNIDGEIAWLGSLNMEGELLEHTQWLSMRQRNLNSLLMDFVWERFRLLGDLNQPIDGSRMETLKSFVGFPNEHVAQDTQLRQSWHTINNEKARGKHLDDCHYLTLSFFSTPLRNSKCLRTSSDMFEDRPRRLGLSNLPFSLNP